MSESGMNRKERMKQRFLDYVTTWTTSDPASETMPSAPRELDLARKLEKELSGMGVPEVSVSDKGYVYGHIPATEGMENRKSVAFISHMDTAPDFSGENVNPIVHENYDGKDIPLPKNDLVIRTEEFPDLLSLKGRTVITADGSTLLGADDKAGVTAIMTAAEELLEGKASHGDLWIVFTPDEEIGKGASGFDFDICKADYGFTVDGGYEGEVAYENFNAASAVITFHGKNVHPGSAKNIMKNAAGIAVEFASSLPAEEVPEKTEGREGFFHLTDFSGDVSEARLDYIIRDHDRASFEARKKKLHELGDRFNEKYGADTVTVKTEDSYYNMIEVMRDHMDVIENARDAIRAAGLTPVSEPVRGGTDGAMLSFKGLPCPNLGTGGYAYHGPYEHCSLEGMETVERIVYYLMTHPLN